MVAQFLGAEEDLFKAKERHWANKRLEGVHSDPDASKSFASASEVQHRLLEKVEKAVIAEFPELQGIDDEDLWPFFPAVQIGDYLVRIVQSGFEYFWNYNVNVKTIGVENVDFEGIDADEARRLLNTHTFRWLGDVEVARIASSR